VLETAVLVRIPYGGANNTYEDGFDSSETSAHKIQMPGNRPKERIQHSEHGESLKSKLHSFNIPSNLCI
jgi:hypothetical protein